MLSGFRDIFEIYYQLLIYIGLQNESHNICQAIDVTVQWLINIPASVSVNYGQNFIMYHISILIHRNGMGALRVDHLYR
jgi:hypothetical protein